MKINQKILANKTKKKNYIKNTKTIFHKKALKTYWKTDKFKKVNE